MARYELHYGGQEYKLDADSGTRLEGELRRFQQGMNPMFVDVTLRRGHTMKLLLSPSIPVALLRDESPKQAPMATFA